MTIRITSRAVVINDENKVLLLKIKDGEGHCWITPGGKIEAGETELEAAKRELFEETGIQVADFVEPHVWYYEHVILINDVPTLLKEHIFLAYVKTNDVHFDNLLDYERDEITNYMWWDIAEFIEKQEVMYPQGLAEDIQNFMMFQQSKRSIEGSNFIS